MFMISSLEFSSIQRSVSIILFGALIKLAFIFGLSGQKFFDKINWVLINDKIDTLFEINLGHKYVRSKRVGVKDYKETTKQSN